MGDRPIGCPLIRGRVYGRNRSWYLLMSLLSVTIYACSILHTEPEPICITYRKGEALTGFSESYLLFRLINMDGGGTDIDLSGSVTRPLSFHHRPPSLVQSSGTGELIFQAIGLWRYDMRSETKRELKAINETEGLVSHFLYNGKNSSILYTQMHRSHPKVGIYDLLNDSIVPLAESDGPQFFLHAGSLSPSGRFAFVTRREILLEKLDVVLEIFDLERNSRIELEKRIQSDKDFSIAANPWSASDDLYLSCFHSGSWHAMEINPVSRAVKQIGGSRTDKFTPCSFGGMTLLVEKMGNGNECVLSLYDANDNAGMTIPQPRRICFNPYTFAGEQFFVFVGSDGVRHSTYLYCSLTGEVREISKGVDPKAQYSEVRNMLLLCEVQRQTGEVLLGEEDLIYPFVDAVKYPSRLVVVNLDDFSTRQMAEDAISAIWLNPQ